MIFIYFKRIHLVENQIFTNFYLYFLIGIKMDEIRYNRLQLILVEFDIDQIELALKLGVNRNSVSRWCRNEVQPSLYQLRDIAKFFRIDIRNLIEPTTWPSETGAAPVEVYKSERRKAKEERLVKNKKVTKTAKKRR
jgi:transcriptional regulator with XRE-family HTH domain